MSLLKPAMSMISGKLFNRIGVESRWHGVGGSEGGVHGCPPAKS